MDFLTYVRLILISLFLITWIRPRRIKQEIAKRLFYLFPCVSGVVEFLTSGRVNANHRDFKEIGYDDCLCKLSFTSDAKDIYTHGFRLAQAYSRETLPFTNYTYVFSSVLYAQNLMQQFSVLDGARYVFVEVWCYVTVRRMDLWLTDSISGRVGQSWVLFSSIPLQTSVHTCFCEQVV